MEKEIYDLIKDQVNGRNVKEEHVKELKAKRNKVSLTKEVKHYRKLSSEDKRSLKSDPTIKEYLKLCRKYKEKLKSLKSEQKVIIDTFISLQSKIKNPNKIYVYVRSYSFNGRLIQVLKDNKDIYLNEYWNIENMNDVKYVTPSELEIFKENNHIIELDLTANDNYIAEFLKVQKEYIIDMFKSNKDKTLTITK